MKKIVTKYKMVVVMVLLVGFTNILFAYQNGDYRSTGNGYWDFPSTWEVYHGGNWIQATTSVSSQNCDIYIKSGHHVKMYSHGQVQKNLIIEENASLTAYNYGSWQKTLLFTGDNILIRGTLGSCDENFKLIIGYFSQNPYDLHKITGLGNLKIKYVDFDDNTFMDIQEVDILSADIRNDQTIVDLSKGHGSSMKFRDLCMFATNTICYISTDVHVWNHLSIGAGTNFDEAPLLKITENGALLLNSKDTSGINEVLKIGANNGYSKIHLSGSIDNKAKITGVSSSDFWSFKYAPLDESGNKFQIYAENAVFSNMDYKGLDIHSRVHILGNEFRNCEFHNSYGRAPRLLTISGSRYLNLYDAVFENSHGYNIHYSSSRGLVQVIGYSGSLAGESHDYDPYNRVRWYGRGKEEIENEIAESSNVTKLDNYPNPFNPTTTISYQLEKDADVNLTIYNLKGQKVTQLVNEMKNQGTHSVIWNGVDEKGNSVPSGVYFYRIEAGEFLETKRMMLLK